jgi:hypothetical protein
MTKRRCRMKVQVKDKENLKKQIDSLSPELLEEVKDFVEFLIFKKGNVDYSYLLSQQKNLEKIWIGEAEDLYEI